MKESYPLFHSKLALEQIDGEGCAYTRLYRWDGQDQSLRAIMLMAHVDVVPVRDAETWSHPPFDGVDAEGYIWGRGNLIPRPHNANPDFEDLIFASIGALNAKSSLMSTLEAIEILLKKGFKPQRTAYIAFGHDAIVGFGGISRVKDHLMGQGVRLEFLLDGGGAILKAGTIDGVQFPVAAIGIAEKGKKTKG